MDDMPRPRPPHLHRQVTRHGEVVWYVRIGHGPRTRIRAAFGTPEFDAEYQAALSNQPPRPKNRTKEGTLTWLVERYRETTAWTGLSLATRRQRENIFRHVLETAGAQPLSRITTSSIMAGRDRRAATPAQARHFLDAMRGLFRWAAKAKIIRTDPTIGVDDPPRAKSDGFLAWTEDHVTAYGRRWPLGTHERVWLAVLLYTGLRRGDAVRLGRQHVRDGEISIKAEKTDTWVTVGVTPEFTEAVEAGPCGDLTFICGKNGKPLTKESFGNEFRRACKIAGVPGSAHGLRKLAATRVAENGGTVAELEAMFGWHGGRMASLYTKKADRRRLSLGATHKLRGNSR